MLGVTKIGKVLRDQLSQETEHIRLNARVGIFVNGHAACCVLYEQNANAVGNTAFLYTFRRFPRNVYHFLTPRRRYRDRFHLSRIYQTVPRIFSCRCLLRDKSC
jgi:hypothetical protein